MNTYSYLHRKCSNFTTLGKNESILLHQINYWINKCGRDIQGLSGKWIYNSLKDWHKQFNFWSISTLRRAIKSLENSGILISKKVNAHRWNHTKWYSINFNKLNKLTNDINNKSIYSNSSLIKFQNSKDTSYYDKKERTNRCVQNEQIIITKNNYTNNISYNEEVSKNNSETKKIKESIIVKDEEEIINKMIYIWNKVFEYSVKPIKAYRNKKNQIKLLNLYRKIFNSDLDKWREYACKVNSSQFLMGEKKTKNNFKAVFGWLIKEETIDKINAGAYGVGDRELDMNNISKNIEEKKEEVVNKMDKKISEYIKIKINDKKEREEFIEYIKSASITEDDRYGILKNIIKQVPKNYILEREEYKEIKENLYESYVMKKHLSITKIEVREKIRNKIKKIIENKENGHKLLVELDKKVKEIEILELNAKMNIKGIKRIIAL